MDDKKIRIIHQWVILWIKNSIKLYTEKSVAFPDPIMCIEAIPLQNLFKQYDTYDFPNLKLIEWKLEYIRFLQRNNCFNYLETLLLFNFSSIKLL